MDSIICIRLRCWHSPRVSSPRSIRDPVESARRRVSRPGYVWQSVFVRHLAFECYRFGRTNDIRTDTVCFFPRRHGDELCSDDPNDKSGRSRTRTEWLNVVAILRRFEESVESRSGISSLPSRRQQWLYNNNFGDFKRSPCFTVRFVFCSQTVSVTVSIMTLTSISIDRWYAICHPMKFKSTTSRARTAIIIIWIVGLASGNETFNHVATAV